MNNDIPKIKPYRFVILFVILLFSLPVLIGQVAKVELYPYMVVNETGDGDATLMVDEQALSADPLNGDNNIPITAWSTGYGSDYPLGAYIDLGQEMNLQHIFIFDYNGIGDLIIEYGTPNNWEYLLTEPLNKYKKWKQHDVNITTRYIRIVKTHASPKFSEIVLYADNPGQPAPAISDLEALNPTNESIDLTWTDVSQNATTGILLGYDLRYSQNMISENNFESCNSFDINLQPLAGTPQTITINGLSSNTTYYFAIKETGELANTTISNISTETTTLFENEIEEIILIEPTMLTNLSGYGDAWKIVDEQELAGDPANSPGGNPITYWQTGFGSSIPYPIYAVLDLGKPVKVTKVFVRDSYDISDFTIWTGNYQNWELKATDNLSGYLSWNQHDINTETRYIRFGKTNASANVAEIMVYGIEYNNGIVDDIPPATITDLAATPGDNPINEIMLSWSASGDDDMQGMCSGYDIRFNSVEITAENFYNSSQWPIVPEPLAAGSYQETIIGGLYPDTKYYFAIVATDDNYNISEVSNISTCTTGFEIGGSPFKLTLSPNMILNEYALGDATYLVDEQQVAGDPDLGNGGKPNSIWHPGSNDWQYPCYAIIDLGGNCLISDIYLYDVDDSDTISVFTGKPFNWNLAFVDELKNNNNWNQHEIKTETRYIRLKIHSEETRISEILVYASRLEKLEEIPEPVTHILPTMDQLIGINAFINDPMGRMAVAGFVREYHSWMWCDGNQDQSYSGYPENQNKFKVMGWNFDYYYQNFAQAGITACPAIQKSVLWLTDFNYSKLNDKPVSPGENTEHPLSYSEHADHLFQYAARYGNEYVNDDLLKLADDQERFTGKKWLKYYENWNEQDKWWKGGDAFFNPYEYAAMSSADKDGHLGTMGSTFGIANADPQARLVMSGLAKPDLNYVKAIKLWSDYYRNGDMPVDVINVHHYCNDGLTQSSGNVGVSPEEDDLKGLMEKFVDYRNRYLPGKEVWITEFGYDTHAGSVQRAPEIGSYSQEEVQAQWLVRSFLALASAGVDKAAMYMLRDVNPNSSTKFNTSGLCGSKANNWEPKPSWYYTYTLKNRLTGMHFDIEIESGNQNVMIYKFRQNETNLGAYVVWCSTSNQVYVDNFEFTIEPDITEAKMVTLTNGNIFGEETTLEINDEKITVDVSEKPVIILTASEGYTFPQLENIIKFPIDASMIINESGQGNPTLMVDEQEIAGDPYMGVGGEPITIWSTSFGAAYPVHAYIDLGEEKDIETIYLRDMNATGMMSFSIGEPGNWTEVATENCGRYKIWSSHIIQQSSRYIRVTKYEPSVNFSEVIIYVRE